MPSKIIKDIEETGIIDAIGDAINIQDRDFKILYQNKRNKEIFGDRVGEYCFKAYQGRDRVCEGCCLALSFKDGKIHTIERSRSMENGIMYFEHTASLIRNSSGKIIAGIEIARDITKRRHIEDQLSHSMNDWKTTFDNITDIITIHDKDFNIIRANKAAEEIFNLSSIEKNKKVQKCFKYYHGTKCPPDGCPSCNCLKTGKTAVFEIYEPHLKMFIEIRAMPRFDENNQISGLIHIVRDITDRKQLEREVIKDKFELERLVTDRTAELIESNRTLLAEIDERKKIEENLRFTEKELIVHLKELKEVNTTLKVLLKQREEDKHGFESNILSNIKHLIMPYIEKLKKNRAMSEELAYLNVLESNLNEIVTPFSSSLSSNSFGFSPKEIQIASLVKDGKQDKDIVEILNISLETVKTHRKNIRKKLRIYSKRINLRSYLMSFPDNR